MFSSISGNADGSRNFAIVHGQALNEIPRDLYIPERALQIIASDFEGPMDLLLYLVKRDRLDIMELDLVEITDQYFNYIGLMDMLQIDLAAEYLVMSATLAEYKSRLLLPKPETDAEEVDPRMELIERLLEYERFKEAAIAVDELPRIERDFYAAIAALPDQQPTRSLPELTLRHLLSAAEQLSGSLKSDSKYRVVREALSTHERMSQILRVVKHSNNSPVTFSQLCQSHSSRYEMAVTLLALTELIFARFVHVRQAGMFGEIHISAAVGDPSA